VLLHELNNHTQYLTALGALDASNSALPNQGEGLACTALEVEELGWLLGLCAGGYGADLLRDRSEADGIGPLVRFVRKALRRIARDLERADREVPALSPRLGWRGAWRVGEFLFWCASASETALAWELEAEGDALLLTCRVSPSALTVLVPVDDIAQAEVGPDWIRFRIAARTQP